MTVFTGRRDRLDAFRRGERWALTEVYQAYVEVVAKLVRCGFRLDAKAVTIPGAGDAERERELVQETFLKAFAESARLAYDGLNPYRPYLLRIAKNLLIDDARRSGRVVLSERPHLEESADEPLDAARSADEELFWRQQRALTVAFVASLTEPMQRFVRLRFEDGLAQQAVADAFGVSRRAVREWEADVVERLRAHLERSADALANR